MGERRPLKVSIVDTSPVLAGSTAVEAFRTTAELAELADHAGFSRYWLSELHGVPTNANTSPEVAVAAVASRTSNLRVGSGGVLLNHRSRTGSPRRSFSCTQCFRVALISVSAGPRPVR